MIQKCVEKCCFFLLKIYIYLNKKQFLNRRNTNVLVKYLLVHIKKVSFYFVYKIVLIKDKIKSLKNSLYFFVFVSLNLQYIKMFSAILIKWQKKQNFRTETLSADPYFGQKNVLTKKYPNDFPSESFRS